MQKAQKRVLAVEDLSCVGKCSLTVALPIISAAGHETSVLPTAILSTHTGGFEGYTFRDLTSDIEPIMEHWEALALPVDAIYTGYLGSFEQIDLVKNLLARFRTPSTLVLVDPAMADNGQMYPAFDESFALGMRGLCEQADIIVPNLTEAAFMLQEPYKGEGYDSAYIEGLLRRLADLGPHRVVLTGVSLEDGKLGAAAYDTRTGVVDYYFSDFIEGYYHGTGDIFASALVGAIVNDLSLTESIKVAVDFTVGAIARSHEAGTEPRYGVDFEHGLADLAASVKRP